MAISQQPIIRSTIYFQFGSRVGYSGLADPMLTQPMTPRDPQKIKTMAPISLRIHIS